MNGMIHRGEWLGLWNEGKKELNINKGKNYGRRKEEIETRRKGGMDGWVVKEMKEEWMDGWIDR